MVPKNLQVDESLWHDFSQRQLLTHDQLEQFKQYYDLLVSTNDIHNLTTITKLEKVLTNHFDDSLALRLFMDLTKIHSISDIGTGAGFPVIPLKIIFPHLHVVLIEVNHKKIEYLNRLIELLHLDNVVIDDRDWRNFLRLSSYEIDLFCARASLDVEELLRMFKPSSPYKKAQLVYWASRHWQPIQRVEPYIAREEWYTLGQGLGEERRLIFFETGDKDS